MTALVLAAEALFASALQPSDEPDPAWVDAAITAQILAHGSCELAAPLAQECGNHPEQAAERMLWCLVTVRACQPAHV
jgi:hypothetical protein